MTAILDVFEDTRKQEAEFKGLIDADISDLQGAIGLAQKALVLKNAPGWDPFVRTVEALLERRKEEMILADSDRLTATLQGRCKELKAILGLMGKAEDSIKTLDERLQYRLAQREKRFHGGKVIPVGAVS